MTEVLVVSETEVLVVEVPAQEVVDQPSEVQIFEVAVQGPPGPPGPQGVPGPVGDASGAFLVTNRFYEIAEDESAKAIARQNLGLAVIDGGTFF